MGFRLLDNLDADSAIASLFGVVCGFFVAVGVFVQKVRGYEKRIEETEKRISNSVLGIDAKLYDEKSQPIYATVVNCQNYREICVAHQEKIYDKIEKRLDATSGKLEKKLDELISYHMRGSSGGERTRHDG